MRNGDSNVLLFKREWPFGLYEHNADPRSLMFSAYRRIASTGAPTGSINYLFLNTEEPLPPKTGDGFLLGRWWDTVVPWRRWQPYRRTLMCLLGTLCYSLGGTLLYFPGYRTAWISGYDKAFNPVDLRNPFEVDHFTLEPGLDRWHITSMDGQRVRKLAVHRFAPNAIFWFAMTVHRASEFEPVYRRNTWSFDCSGSDAQRRLEDIVASEKGVEFHVVERAHAERMSPKNDQVLHLWHFEFLVRLGSKDDLPEPRLILPGAPLAVIAHERQIPVRRHVVRLRGFDGAVIVDATRLSGTLSTPVLLTHL